MAFTFINDVNFESYVNIRGKSIFSFTFFQTKSYNTIADLKANLKVCHPRCVESDVVSVMAAKYDL